MKILFLSALESEAREFQRHFNFKKEEENKKQSFYSLTHEALPENLQCHWGITGVGPKAVKRFIKFISNVSKNKYDSRANEDSRDYELVILTGYCGALKKENKAGDMLVSPKVHLWNSSESIELDAPDRLPLKQIESVTLSVLADEKIKREILDHYPQAAFVDMESFYLARYFKDKARRVWLMRSVTDGPGFRFPEFKFIQDSLKMILKKGLLFELLLRPKQLYRLLRLVMNIRKAQKGLFNTLAPLIQRGFQGYL